MSKLRAAGMLFALVLGAAEASAADVPGVAPVLVAPVTIAVPAAPLRIVVLEVTPNLYPGFVEWYGAGAVDVRLPSGFGLRLDGGLRTVRAGGDGNDSVALGARVYRGFGEATVGMVAAARFLRFYDLGIPGPFLTSLVFGIDGDYHTDAVELAFLVGARFDDADAPAIALDEFRAVVDATVQAGSRVEIATVAFLTHTPGFDLRLDGDTELRYRIGPVSPFVRVTTSIGGGFSAVPSVGFSVEHAINGGPLKLTGRTEFWGTGGFSFKATAGFEYDLGDGPLTLRGGATAWSGGVWQLSLGIGAEFGNGRLTGFLNPDHGL